MNEGVSNPAPARLEAPEHAVIMRPYRSRLQLF
ncbi:hypothetical protein BOS5A_230615 [Bosea sp. EC-HK365B]|nr:hypothetical protein BOSE21B_90689 [Bosea sp. 21B]VVT61338.1 hypothetical protein BOS5A_230615 [Bosea sp. EC-HK365B]